MIFNLELINFALFTLIMNLYLVVKIHEKKNYWLDSELLLNNLIITVSCYSFSELLKHISWNHHSLSQSEKSNNAFRSYTVSQNYKHNRSFIRHYVKNWKK